MGSLDGRIALVTGAGRRRGIGRGIVQELVRAGAGVAVHAREWDEAAVIAEMCRQVTGTGRLAGKVAVVT